MTTMTGATTMRAACIHAFGGPEVLQIEEIAVPEPQENQILVHVHTAGVNPVDWKIREGHLGKVPLPSIMGNDFSGVVEAMGAKVEEFRVGEPVFGTVADESGSYAEFAMAPVQRAVEKPPGMDHPTASALPTPSLTAWQALFDHAQLERGQRVLIHAAAGGVGSFAVQFAAWKGAYVIGTASGKHIDYVRQLGANEVIDYKKQRFEEIARDVDVVLDTIGGETQQHSWPTLRARGILVSTVQPPVNSQGRRGLFFRCDHGRSDQLGQIASLVVSGEVRVHIEASLPLAEARRAQELSQAGHIQGKIVLKIV